MKSASRDYIINTVYRTNILPVISVCNTSCVFCSHKQNPAGIEVYKMDKLSLEDFEEIIEFLSPDRKIIIGESATRIIEGEPLLHNDFIGIVELVRSKYRNTLIQITTNGILLDNKLIERLQKLQNIEMNVSVNCISDAKRKVLLGLKKPDNIKDKISLLEDRINFTASAVFDPDIMSFEDIEEMAAFLDNKGVSSIRLFLPGYTYLAKKNHNFYRLHDSLKGFTAELKSKYRIPVTVEPSNVYDLVSRVEGVMLNSPAHIAGVKEGDIIKKVDDTCVRTRVEAFNRAFRLKDPEVDIVRDDKSIRVTIKKDRNAAPGFIMLYDIDPDEAERTYKLVQRYKAKNVLFMTSELAYNVIRDLFETSDFTFRYDIVKVDNAFFGGTIKCAGLLTAQDVISKAKEHIKENGKPDLIVLPPVMFDYKRTDLMGRSVGEIEAELGIAVDFP